MYFQYDLCQVYMSKTVVFVKGLHVEHVFTHYMYFQYALCQVYMYLTHYIYVYIYFTHYIHALYTMYMYTYIYVKYTYTDINIFTH